MNAQIRRNERTLPDRAQLGAQIIGDLSQPVLLDPPPGAVQVHITVDGAPVQWTRDRRGLFDWRPWIAKAQTLPPGAVFDCASDLRSLRFAGMAPGASIDVRYYGSAQQQPR